MIYNFLKVALRNLLRNKSFSIINILGLAIGLTCFIFIALWIQDEFSFDKHNEDFERIYQAGIDFKLGELEGRGITTTAPLAPAMMNEIPEVESGARFMSSSTKLVASQEVLSGFLEDNVYYADSTIFNVFTIPLLQGDPKDLLTRKKTVVITYSIAQKYFPTINPIGQNLTFDNNREYEVVGVVQDCPHNSHWKFDMLVSMISIQRAYSEEWLSDNLHTYFKLQPDADQQVVEKKINELFRRNAEPIFQQFVGVSISEWEKQGNHYFYVTTPLSRVYLYNEAMDSIGEVGDIRYVFLFAAIGFLILLVACINFMNLTTARSGVRAKEIGMRKVLGSNRRQLIQQFLFESLIISFIAMLIALITAQLLMPFFNELTDKELDLNFGGLYTFPIIIFVTLFVGFLAGGYSAVSLSSYDILTILKGSLFKGKSKSWFRNALVLFQFSISILVIVCTIIVYSQMKFVNSKKLGFQKEQLIVVDRAHILGDQLDVFKQEILKNPGIQFASKTYTVPGKGNDGSMYQKIDSPPEEMFHFRKVSGDFDYLKTLGIKLKSGRYFSADIASDSTAIVLNETAVRMPGYEDPIGQVIVEPGSNIKHQIIGVVKDYHTLSLHLDIPSLMMLHPSYYWKRYLAVRILPQNTAASLSFIKQKWLEFSGNQPLEFFFMDSYFESLYNNEMRSGTFFIIFAALAIFIACLGLFGLAAFTAEQKTKEIGVRKVLGASIPSIVSILLKQFTKWVLLANIIAWPIAYYIMKSWLQNFAYRIDLNISYFILSGMITLMIAIITVSYLSINAATRNPVEALKYE
ncbi:MAG: ABC transporter permease [Candidatus Cloacimonetes bacterium]|nr:ABC transporter permease [Candidatus Cloacimonadota bacterium]MCF7813605.1 ABC transporter permease [Candidatus Cloacimonadota bacterium]MCF7867921.1 ABC transporter permease [Candidatus Cloacimonadota bacterium]MCF7882886.1 ABC transporter permease [Candidatus Cloacimonadota bacterium]